MKEAFLQYLWEKRLIPSGPLTTTEGETLLVLHPGERNIFAGPDFFQAHIRLGAQEWVGTVEIHLKASQWYGHHHQLDQAYRNVILHVVWEDDLPVRRNNGVEIPCLELQNFIPNLLLDRYRSLHKRDQRVLRCEPFLKEIPEALWKHWLHTTGGFRMMQKAEELRQSLKRLKGDREALLFELLVQSFVGGTNRDAAQHLLNRLPYSVWKKYLRDLKSLEALLFGVAGFLTEKGSAYETSLHAHYAYLVQKHRLSKRPPDIPFRFSGMRPEAFPTVRLSQLAVLYDETPFLFSVICLPEAWDLITEKSLQATSFWDTRYTFRGELHAPRKKRISTSLLSHVEINVRIPLLLCLTDFFVTPLSEEEILKSLEGIASEKHRYVRWLLKAGIKVANARESQGSISLLKDYCLKSRCLECAVGQFIMQQ